MNSKSLHEKIQFYLEQVYQPYASEIQKSSMTYKNEHYGELYYYSYHKLLIDLKINESDHFLDIGSGLGKIMWQTFLTTCAASVWGIEINAQRYQIARQIQDTLRRQLPNLFKNNRQMHLIHGDFLTLDFTNISIVYVCSTVFSFELLNEIGKKINGMQHVRKIASFRKLPHLANFKLIKKTYLHADWERVSCFIYERKVYC